MPKNQVEQHILIQSCRLLQKMYTHAILIRTTLILRMEREKDIKLSHAKLHRLPSECICFVEEGG